MRRRARPEGGFTTVELVVVLLLAGLLAAVALPRLVDRGALEERAFLDRLRGLLRETQALAVSQGRPVCAMLAAPSVRIVYQAGGACALALPVAGPGGGALAVPVPAGVVLGGATQVVFDAQGRPVPNLSATVLVGANALTVQAETGYVP